MDAAYKLIGTAVVCAPFDQFVLFWRLICPEVVRLNILNGQTTLTSLGEAWASTLQGSLQDRVFFYRGISQDELITAPTFKLLRRGSITRLRQWSIRQPENISFLRRLRCEQTLD